MRERVLERLFGLSFGIVRQGKEWSLMRGLAPTYALNLQGKHYNLSSGYSVRMYREIISSRLYENLSLSLPGLPTLRLAYAKQDTKDTQKEHKIDSTGSNIQLGIEDEIGPFRITINKREYSLKDQVRGPKYDVKSSATSGNVDFTYLYRRLFSLNGQYGIGQLRTERKITEENPKEKSRDFSWGFRISPISTIALSGMMIGRREQREGWKRESSNASLTNRLQLMLQPVEGMLLNATYFKSDTFRDEERLSSNESKSLVLNVEVWQNLAFFGNFMVYDSQESEKKLSTLKRNSFELRAEPIEGLRISSRLDLSKSADLISGIRNNKNNVTTRLEAMPTENFKTDISYDWQKFSRTSIDITDEEVIHRIALAANYSFARMLNFNLKSGKNISSKWEDRTTFLTCVLNYSKDKSYVNFRYNRVSSPGNDRSSLQKKQLTMRTLTVVFGQKVGRDTDLHLSYESRLGKKEFSYTEMKRISFRVNIRF